MSRTTAQLVADRARLMGPNVATFYDDPIHFVKAMVFGCGTLRGVNIWIATIMCPMSDTATPVSLKRFAARPAR